VNSEAVHVEDKTQEAAMETFSGSMPKPDRLTQRVQSLEKWYATDFERRIAALAALMETQIRQELRAQFMAELNTRMQQARKQYEESIYAQFGRWESQRQLLLNEIEDLRHKVPGDELMAEIASAEKSLNDSEGKTSLERQAQIVAYVKATATNLTEVATGRVRLSDEWKKRFLTTFLNLMNLHESLDRSANRASVIRELRPAIAAG